MIPQTFPFSWTELINFCWITSCYLHLVDQQLPSAEVLLVLAFLKIIYMLSPLSEDPSGSPLSDQLVTEPWNDVNSDLYGKE